MKLLKRNKLMGLIFGMFLFFIVPKSVFANDITATLSGSDSISPGEKVSYTLTAKEGVLFAEGDTIVLKLNYPSSSMTYKSTNSIDENVWAVSDSSYTDKITFTCQVKTCSTSIGVFDFQVASKPAATKATISVSGTHNSGNITNNMKINSKTVSIKSNDATLKSLKVNDEAVDGFASDIYEYNINVTGDVENVSIKGDTNSSKASLKKGEGNRTVALQYGANTIKVTVVSEAGTSQTYVLNITREDDRSDDTTLSGIKIDGEDLENFSSTKYKYTIKKYKMTEISIEGITNDVNATAVTKTPDKIIIGDNTYTITVTSENGQTSDYTVIVNNIDTKISKMLKMLYIKGYDLGFDKNNYKYTISYNKSKFKNLSITATTVASKDEVNVTISPDITEDENAYKNLKPGDKIVVTVTGIDGESSEYIIDIVKDSRPSFFLFLEIFLMLVVIALIVVLVIKRKKKNNKSTGVKKAVNKTEKKDDSLEKENNVKEDITAKDEQIDNDESKKEIQLEVPEEEVKEEEEYSSRRERRRRGEESSIDLGVLDDEEFETTKELSTEELNLK